MVFVGRADAFTSDVLGILRRKQGAESKPSHTEQGRTRRYVYEIHEMSNTQRVQVSLNSLTQDSCHVQELTFNVTDTEVTSNNLSNNTFLIANTTFFVRKITLLFFMNYHTFRSHSARPLLINHRTDRPTRSSPTGPAGKPLPRRSRPPNTKTPADKTPNPGTAPTLACAPSAASAASSQHSPSPSRAPPPPAMSGPGPPRSAPPPAPLSPAAPPPSFPPSARPAAGGVRSCPGPPRSCGGCRGFRAERGTRRGSCV